MPGTPEEYLSDPNTSQAIGLIDQAISEQKGGAEIIDMLEGSGLRVYTADSEEGPVEEPLEEMPMEEPPLEEELPMEEGMMGEEAPMSEMGLGDEPRSGDDGGMRDMRMDAVRFALEKDKKNKEQLGQEF